MDSADRYPPRGKSSFFLGSSQFTALVGVSAFVFGAVVATWRPASRAYAGDRPSRMTWFPP